MTGIRKKLFYRYYSLEVAKDACDINPHDIRIISCMNIFVRYFDEDPFGAYMP